MTDIYLFSNDLRVDDNPALVRACASQSLVFVFAFDSSSLTASAEDQARRGLVCMGAQRFRFLLESLRCVHDQLRARGQSLWVLDGKPKHTLPQLAAVLNSKNLYCAHQIGLYERENLEHVQAECAQRGLSLHIEQVQTHTLFDVDQGNWLHSELGSTFSKFRRVAEKHKPCAPIQAPKSLPSHKPMDISVLPALLPFQHFESKYSCAAEPQSAGDLESSGHLSEQSGVFIGGEKNAQIHLKRYFSSELPASYKATRNALDGWDNSAKLSAWLSLGCVSVRRVKVMIDGYEQAYKKNESTYWLYFELLWREYFQWQALALGADLFKRGGSSNKTLLTTYYPERFKKWCTGKTPYPLVNACMRELKATGYISNRSRQIVASCLINELNLDWRYGASWFEQQLVDYDVAVNWGNWQYLAGVGCDPRGSRHFNIDKQHKLFDPNNIYCNKWLANDPPADTLIDSQDIVGWPV